MNQPTLASVLSTKELEFLRQLFFESQLAVTVQAVEIVASLKEKITLATAQEGGKAPS